MLYAIVGGDLDTVRVLLAAGANVDEAGPDDMTALMLALIKRHEEIALFLLTQGADPNPADAGYTALHLASATGHFAVAETLLERGADPNLRLERPQRITNAFETGLLANLRPEILDVLERLARPVAWEQVMPGGVPLAHSMQQS